MSYKILVMSCDKNQDLFKPYNYFMEKYWKDHPEIYYSTESVDNPYYKTIHSDLPIEKWTKRVVESVKQIDSENILLMVDDIFVRNQVNSELVNNLDQYIGGIVAGLNFEKSFDSLDIPLNDLVSVRNHKGKYKTSLMCQLWNKKALLDLFDKETTPWDFEEKNESKHYLFLISRYGNFLNWGYGERKWFGIRKGKWCKECKELFDKENIEIDFSIRGFYE